MSHEIVYREYAAQCLCVADTGLGEAERGHLLDMAEQWLRWADLEKKKERPAGGAEEE